MAIPLALQESRRIKSDQTCLLVCPPLLTSAATREGLCCATFAPYRGYALGLARIKPNQGESNQIKPNQTCRDGSVRRCNSLEKAQKAQKLLRLCDFCALLRLFRWPCKNQGESNRIKPVGVGQDKDEL